MLDADAARLVAFARLWRRLLTLLEFVAGAVLGAAVMYELETSALQARVFSAYAARLSYTLQPGASARVAFPQAGPFDRQRGYSAIPALTERLGAKGFQVVAQAHGSTELTRLVSWGVTPPYPEVPVVGLTIRGAGGAPLFDATVADRVFRRFDDVPPLLVEALLFMENRELLQPFDARSNPVIEWDRLAKAGLLFVGTKLGLPVPLQGGSTLATQLEKYRHSPAGRTGSALEKLRQVTAASLRAYHGGEDTRPWRHQIVVDYLNTLPLAAAPGHGELYGLGDGLYAWFGLELADVSRALTTAGMPPSKIVAFKDALALIAAVRAPTFYLLQSRAALEKRVDDYTRLLAANGVLDPAFASAVIAAPLAFLPHAPVAPRLSYVEQKAPNAVRTTLMTLLDVPSLYDLDRLHLAVDSTVDVGFENAASTLLQRLTDPAFVKAHGLTGEHLLQTGDARKVLYSLMLFERTPEGNLLRVHADNLDRPFDINDGVKLELGSTAKLRTLAHYLELVAGLYHELSPLDAKVLTQRAKDADDPITQWAATALAREKSIALASFLQRALDRKYSASPYETFFTGGGVHHFGNFERSDNGRILTIREGLQRSVNLVFIRLMRDLVRFHVARLPYDPRAVLGDADNPDRQRMLTHIADDEALHFLFKAYRAYRGLDADAIATRLLGKHATSPRHWTMLFFAWHTGADESALGAWMTAHLKGISPDAVHRLFKAYGNPRLTLADYGYLLGRHPLEVWCAGELARQPGAAWSALRERSAAARRVVSTWLFKTRNRRAQDVRLRIRIEQDAFARMTPYWQRLGFPFHRLVPSYATAIGSSSDRPAALARLMGIIVNDGVRRPTLRVRRLEFAKGTPYETVFEPAADTDERVMEPVVAQTLRTVLSEVVSLGTARRVQGAFVRADGTPVVVGGKTGSGDNRFDTFTRYGGLKSSRATSRTATFVFYIGDRYFGVLTALVPGRDAAAYSFTSSLPLSILKLAAPIVNPRL